MEGIYATNNTVTIDLSKVGKVTVAGGGGCNAGMQLKPTVEVSKENANTFHCWAQASFRAQGIDPATMKVYIRKTAASYPRWDSADPDYIGQKLKYIRDLAAMQGDPPPAFPQRLDAGLAKEQGEGLAFIYSQKYIKLRVERAGGEDMDIHGFNDKDCAVQIKKFYCLEKPNFYYTSAIKMPNYKPNITATVSPIWYSFPNTAGRYIIKVTDLEGYEAEGCASSVCLINQYTDFGYWYNNVVDGLAPPPLDDLAQKWINLDNSSSPIIAQYMANSYNNVPMPTALNIGNGSSEPYLRIDADFSRSMSWRVNGGYILGAPFSDNAIEAVVPDSWRITAPIGGILNANAAQFLPFVRAFLGARAAEAAGVQAQAQSNFSSAAYTIGTPNVTQKQNIPLNITKSSETLEETRPPAQKTQVQQNLTVAQEGLDET